MNYELVTAGNQTYSDAGIKTNVNAGQARHEKASDNEYILLPLMLSNSLLSLSTQSTDDKDVDEVPDKGDDDKEGYANITNRDSTTSPSVSTVGPRINTATAICNLLENTCIIDDAKMKSEVMVQRLTLTTSGKPPLMPVLYPQQEFTRIHKDHPIDQIIGDINSATQTRRMTKISEEHAMVWTLVDLPKGKRAIGTKWVYRNKRDERGIIVRNRARLVAQGYTQEEGINYDEVFAPISRIEAIRLFLAYASFMGFIVYQMDVKSAFLYGTIEEEVYVCQPHAFEDPQFPDKVYKKEDGIFISQDKYVADILKKFDFVTVKTASTLMEPNKALVKDKEDDNVDVHLYRSMIGSLMYLTASRPDITFAVCACARFQVILKISHLHAVKRIIRYLKGQPNLCLWYPRDSPFDLEAFSDSDYAGASLDRKSIIGGCQFLGKRLFLWQCKKQTIVYNSTTETEYVAAANCCGQDRQSSMARFDEMRQLEILSMLALQAEEGEGSGNPSEPQPPPSTDHPTHEEPIPNIESSSPQKTQSTLASL
ncbi:ribonuclease H-like domain-containing protein [Tanacetum coccineum]